MDFLELTERIEKSSESGQDQDDRDKTQSWSFFVDGGSFPEVEKEEEESEAESQVEKQERVFFE